uniref:Uncharacterized protein n=1 Tax=Anguilla anguilla TaxID=7936 RepID=A0A0E9Q235_ANGAN
MAERYCLSLVPLLYRNSTIRCVHIEIRVILQDRGLSSSVSSSL